MWYQHDGCPAYYFYVVRTDLNDTFQNRWIGRGSISPWPSRTLHLARMDFYFWGQMKDLVYTNRPTSANNMKKRIRAAIRSISRAEIECVVASTTERLKLCSDNDGKHFEHLIS